MLKAWFDNPNLTKLDEKEYEAMVDDYRRVYSGDAGERILLTELINLSFFQSCRNDADMWKSNMAKELLCRLGIWNPNNADKIVRKLMEVL